MPMPNIKTECTIKGTEFKFTVFAYRKLSAAEMKYCAKEWLRKYHKNCFPQKGSGKIISILGFDGR
jgi:hypothetical protein